MHLTHTCSLSHYCWWRQQWAAATSGESETFGWWLLERIPSGMQPSQTSFFNINHKCIMFLSVMLNWSLPGAWLTSWRTRKIKHEAQRYINNTIMIGVEMCMLLTSCYVPCMHSQRKQDSHIAIIRNIDSAHITGVPGIVWDSPPEVAGRRKQRQTIIQSKQSWTYHNVLYRCYILTDCYVPFVPSSEEERI